MSVTLRLEDEVDVSRGDMIVHAAQPPDRDARGRGDRLLDGRRAAARGREVLAQAHDEHRARGRRHGRAHRSTSTRSSPSPTATELQLNEIGLVRLRTSAPLLVDPYRTNRRTGAFILVDEATNVTVGAGMVE